MTAGGSAPRTDRADGMIDREGGFVVFRYERALPQPVPRVWAAVTEPAGIERWLGRRPSLDLRPGGAYVVGHGQGGPVADRVLRVEPPTLFEHTFRAPVNPDSRVTWELADAPDGSMLTLTHRLSDADLENAAATVAAGDDRGLIIARNAAGWRRVLDTLEAALAAG